MRGCVRDGSKIAIGSLRDAFCSVSPNSRAVSNRFHGCLAMALWTTRLIRWLTVGIQLRGRRRDLREDRLDDCLVGGGAERLPPRQRLVRASDPANRCPTGPRPACSAPARATCTAACPSEPGGAGIRVCGVCDAEVDDLHGIVGHHEDVARLQVAMHQTAFVSRLEARHVCEMISTTRSTVRRWLAFGSVRPASAPAAAA